MFLLVINSMFLILLVLVQLPKKDAGAGMAFGAGTADALFGAGSGNILTKVTGWAAGILLALALVLGWVQGTSSQDNSGTAFTKMVEQKQQQVPISAPSAPAPQPKPQSTPPANGLLSVPMQAPATNAPAPASTPTTPAK
jgi:preprotein translocase subunit SecG